jgi:hypothetical protein
LDPAGPGQAQASIMKVGRFVLSHAMYRVLRRRWSLNYCGGQKGGPLRTATGIASPAAQTNNHFTGLETPRFSSKSSATSKCQKQTPWRRLTLYRHLAKCHYRTHRRHCHMLTVHSRLKPHQTDTQNHRLYIHAVTSTPLTDNL